VAYDDQGQGEPVLLIHAFPLNRTMWASQVAALTEAGYRVIAPDLRGFGESEPPAGPLSLDDLAADLLGLLDHLDIAQAVVGGLSMGGYIAFRLLARAPERLSALVLADTRAGVDSPPAVATRLERAALAEREGVAPVAAAMLPGMVAGGQVERADPAVLARIQALMATASPAGVAAALRAMAARPDALPALAAITCPTLVLCGAEDVLTPPAEARLMAESIPQAQLVLIEGAGHLANLEQPAAFNAALLDFLARRGGA
jgi:pimeloyl-ACP methyl ester carboxylesterase